MRRLLFGVAILWLFLATTAWAKPLVTLGPDGAPQAALASAWETLSETSVAFSLDAASFKAAKAAILTQLPQLTVEEKGARLVVSGLAQNELFAKLALIDIPQDIEPQDNPFGNLPKGTAIALAPINDGSGSVRVAKPGEAPAALTMQFTGRVVKVEQGCKFPDAIIEIKLETPPLSSFGGRELKKGDVIRVRPVYALTKDSKELSLASLDLGDRRTQLNLGAWFLMKGDLLIGELSGIDGDKKDAPFTANSLQRKPL